VLLASNLSLINGVVAPVAVVTDAAKRISGGSYGIQIPNKYSDEMGELVDNINDMSLKISQSEKMQTEFISSVSHELRTPLTAITGWGETLLADESGDMDQLRRGVRIILNESRRLTNMVEELLEFSKMQDGRFTLRVERVDLQAELEDAIYTYRELFRQDGIALEYESGGELFEGHQAELRVRRRGPAPHPRRLRAAEAGVLQRVRQRRQARRRRQAHRRLHGAGG